MADELSEYDRHYLSTISSSIKRARSLLISITLIAAWVLASQLTYLIKWQNVRTPASYNIANAADTVLASLKLTVPVKHLRPSDEARHWRQVNTLRSIGASMRDSSVEVHYPKGESFEEKLDWCQHYYQFILAQCQDSVSSDTIDLVRILLDRGEISDTKLPKDYMKRPLVDVPVVGLRVDFDDISIVGAVILMVAMIWFRLALKTVKENISVVRSKLRDKLGKRAFFEDWLPMQFLFIPKPSKSPPVSSPAPPPAFAYLLFFVPYIAVLFSLLVDIHDIFWQVSMYSAITRSEWIPLLGKASSYYFEETIGIVTLRLGILTIITVFLAREAWKAWSIMVDVSRREKFDRGQSNPGQSNRGESGGDRFQLWLQFIVITVIPIFIMNVWTIARFLSFEESLKNYGWSYGPSLYGSLAFLLTIVLLIILLVQLNTWRKMTSKSSLEKNANS